MVHHLLKVHRTERGPVQLTERYQIAAMANWLLTGIGRKARQ
jgi:hypothetical protein